MGITPQYILESLDKTDHLDSAFNDLVLRRLFRDLYNNVPLEEMLTKHSLSSLLALQNTLVEVEYNDYVVPSEAISVKDLVNSINEVTSLQRSLLMLL